MDQYRRTITVCWFLSAMLLLCMCGAPIKAAAFQSQRSIFNSFQRRALALFFSNSNAQRSDSSVTGSQDERQVKYQQLMDASTLSLAPMMEYTDRHFRHLVRLISKRTLLYTEMVAANAIARERKDCIDRYTHENPTESSDVVRANYDDHFLKRYLAQGSGTPLQQEGPCVLQLGGSDPRQLHEAAETVGDMARRGHCDYTAINLNCGCPSPKVVAGKGCFGAALMDDPKLVAELTQAIHDGCRGALPVTVKCRIGTDTHHPFTKHKHQATMSHAHDDNDDSPNEELYETLCRFVETVASNGVATDFSVHARIAVLQKSFSPADNRNIPPLRYDVVQRLVQDYPELTFTLNGGIDSISQVQAQLQAAPGLGGVMVGRAFAADPWSFSMADELLYGEDTTTATGPKKNRLQILEEYGRHADAEEAQGDPTKIRRFIVKAAHPLFAGEANSKRYRIALDAIAGIPKKLKLQGKTMAGQPPVSELIMNAALEHLSQETLLRTPEESYERVRLEEQRRRQQHLASGGVGSGRSQSINDWQTRRKEQAENVDPQDQAAVL